MKKIIFLILLLMLSLSFADDLDNDKRYQNLVGELRCLVCQNESLADSDAPLAKDLRQVIKQQLQMHKTDTEIIQYLTARYGEFILFKPSFSYKNLLLWLGPFIILILGVIVLSLSLYQRAAKFNKVQALSPEEKQHLEKLLK